MAESQLTCMDDDHVNEKIPESKPEFYYSEEQRAALEQLLRNGDGAFKMRLKEDNARDFLSAREVKWIRQTFHEYDTDSDSETGECEKAQESNADSGVHSTYWPQMSDTEVPSLDIGWPGGSGFYKGVTRVSVYTHPPKENSPHIKEVVRRLIQESNKVVAVVMDLLTDLQILQDLLDAASRRGVAVYAVLEERGLPHFLDMCSRLQVTAVHLRNLRVRTVKGSGMCLSFGKLPGSLASKFMLVDGDKVMFGSYSFTWSSSRVDRNTITVMTGNVVDAFDTDFRELYAASEQVDLYKEFHIGKPPMPAPARRPSITLTAVTDSRFQVSLDETRPVNLKVPAHKYHNPKYSLVVGYSLKQAASLQDLSTLRDSLAGQSPLRANGLQKKPPNAGGESVEKKLERALQRSPGSSSVEDEEGKGGLKKPPAFGGKKQRSSFRLFLKGRGASTDTIEEGVVTTPPPSPAAKPSETNSKAATAAVATAAAAAAAAAPVAAPAAAPTTAPADAADELQDSFEIIEKPSLPKFKNKKPSKLTQRSMSLQTINTAADDDGLKGRKRPPKRNCIQS